MAKHTKTRLLILLLATALFGCASIEITKDTGFDDPYFDGTDPTRGAEAFDQLENERITWYRATVPYDTIKKLRAKK